MFDLGTWYVALGMWGLLIVCLNDDLKLALTYVRSRSSLLPIALKCEIF